MLAVNTQEAGAITNKHLTPGDCVSINQYITQVHGHLRTSQGRKNPNDMYKGGTIFVNHA